MSGLKDLLASIITDSAWMTCAVTLRTVTLVLTLYAPTVGRYLGDVAGSTPGASRGLLPLWGGRKHMNRANLYQHAVLVEICSNQFCAD